MECSDFDLFRQGACHIFADELMQLLPTPKGQMKRIRLAKQHFCFEAVHVYIEKGGIAFDVYEPMPEQECLNRAKEQWSKPGDEAEVETFPCGKDDLFCRDENSYSTEVGWKSGWNLYLDAEFVAACRFRARAFIMANASRYGIA